MRNPLKRLFARATTPAPKTTTSRKLTFHELEDRAVPATLYVDNPADYTVTTDVGAPGLSTGDTVTWNSTSNGGPIAGLIFGTNAFSDITSAITASVNADTIQVAEGTYSENVILSKQLNLLGAKSGVDARGRVVGAPNPAVESIITPPSGRPIELADAADNTTIDGFSVVANFSGTDGAISSQIGAGAGNNNLVIQNNYVTVSGANNVSALYLNRTAIDALIQNNEFRNNSGNAVFFDAPDQFHGLRFINNNVIRSGIAGGTGVFVDGNRNVSNTGSINSPLIKGNLIENFSAGMNLGRFAFANGEISENNFNLNTLVGLQGGIANTVITRNTFTGTGASAQGLQLTPILADPTDPSKGAFNNTVTQNTFVGNPLNDIFLSEGQFPGAISSNIINNNSFASAVGIFYRGEETINASGNWWGSSSFATVSSKIQNPTNERQWLGIKNGVTGTLTLQFGANITGPITVNAGSGTPAAAVLQSALEALPSIGVGNVLVSLNGNSLDIHRRFYIIEFQGALANTNVSQLVLDASGLVGGTLPRATVATLTNGAHSFAIDYTPYLNSGSDTNLGTLGFQGDYSDITVHAAGNQSGSPERITEGYNVLTATGTIHVLGGTYTENVDLGAGSNKAVTLSAGASPAQVTVNGNLTLTSNDNFPVEINGTNAATDYDNFIVNGMVSLGNATLPALTGTHVPVADDIFTIINNDGSGDAVTGTFNGLPAGTIVTLNGQNLKIFYTGNDGNDVILAHENVSGVYVDDSFTPTIGNFIPDADLGTTGSQPAIYGYNAFNTINAALAAAVLTSSGTVIVNGGTYAETVVLSGTQTLEVTGPNAAQTVNINSLTTIAGQSVVLEGSSTLVLGDATSSSIAGVISGSGNLEKTGTGTLTVTGTNTYSGTTTISQGVLQANTSAALGNGSATNTLVFNGGTLQATGTISSPSTRAVTMTATGIIDTNGNNVSIAGAIGSTGGLTKDGTGTLTLSGTNPYAGTTNVNAGTLLVNGTNNGGGAVEVNSAATLGGTGTITGPVNGNASGTVSPGSPTNTIGNLTTGDFDLDVGSTLAIQMSGNNNADRVTVNGAVDVTGATLSLSPLAYTPVIGHSYTIINNDGVDPVVGTFNGLLQGAAIYNFLGTGLTAHINYQGGTGNDVVISVNPVVVIPGVGLHVYGNNLNNVFSYQLDAAIPGNVRVIIDNVYYGSFTPPLGLVRTFGALGNDTVILNGGDGNDTYTVGPDVTAPDSLHDKDFALNGITFTSHNSEAYQLKAGNGNDTFNVYGLGVQAGTVATGDTNVYLEGGMGSDQINSFLTAADVGGNGRTDWNITGPQRGYIEDPAGLTFNWVEEAEGNGLDDYFTFANGGSMPGAPGLPFGIVGAGGANTMNMAASTTAVTVTFTSATTANTSQGPASGITSLVGSNATTDRITGANLPATWNITDVNDGTYNAGTLVTFDNFETLVGGTGVDTFVFDADGRITGQLDGGSQGVGTRDVIDLTARATAITVTVTPPTIKEGVTNLVGSWTSVEEIQANPANAATNNLTAANGANTWTLTAANAGTLNALTFSGFGTLQGGTSTDSFLLGNTGSATSLLGGSGTDTLSYAGATTAVAVSLTSTAGGAVGTGTRVTGFTGMDSLIGSSSIGSDSLTGTAAGDAIMITGAGTGTINTSLPFSSFEALSGGAGNDTYTITTVGALLGISVDAAGGTNTLVGANRTNVWMMTGLGSGSLDSGLSFSNMQNLTGGSGVDTFNFTSGSITGILNGGGHNDILQVGANNVTLTSNVNGTTTGGLMASFISIENLQASGSSTLTGANISNIWRLTGANAGLLNSTTLFSGFSNIVGNNNQDRLQPYQGYVTSFDAVGTGTGSDVLDYAGTSVAAVPRPYNVTPAMLTAGTVLSGVAGFSINITNFEIVSGNIYA